MPFMKDENINDYLDFQSGGYSAQNPLHWASWAITIPAKAKYDVKFTRKCDVGGKLEFYLVNIATNEQVFATTEEIWFQKNETDFAEQTISTQLDFSAIPAGNYMLKVKNNTTWGANLKVQKFTLENVSPNPSTDISETDSRNKARVWNSNGKLMIESEGTYNVAVHSLTGEVVFTDENTTSTEANLAQGVYIVKLTIDGKNYSEKLIIR
ncbi:T9SS C-terminal target domain-containing protein [Paludibacter sp. 221]|nr:T9SS C-terminal target domain-containing protein [Paludibacter sp. 221]